MALRFIATLFHDVTAAEEGVELSGALAGEVHDNPLGLVGLSA